MSSPAAPVAPTFNTAGHATVSTSGLVLVVNVSIPDVFPRADHSTTATAADEVKEEEDSGFDPVMDDPLHLHCCRYCPCRGCDDRRRFLIAAMRGRRYVSPSRSLRRRFVAAAMCGGDNEESPSRSRSPHRRRRSASEP